MVRPVVEVEGGPIPQNGAGIKADTGTQVATQALAEAPPAIPPFSAQVRTLGLRVAARSPLLPFEVGQWRASEQYRILRTKIVHHPKQPRMIVISSPAPGDGKSVSAINTAASLSLKSEAQVLLLDADFRKSALHTLLGLPQAPGLAEVLRGACTPEEAVVRTRELPNLFVLTAGTTPANPAELLDSSAWRALSSQLRSLFRYVILDSPPVGAVADYELIQAVCDGVVLVVRPDHTNRKLWQASLEAVPQARFLGVLLNCVPEWSLARHVGSDYYYYSGERDGRANGATNGTEQATCMPAGEEGSNG